MSKVPVILFEPDGFVLDGPKLMGRQSAGNSFLRAAIHAAEDPRHQQDLFAWTPFSTSVDVFKKTVEYFSKSVKTHWVPTHRLDLLSSHGALFLPGPGLAQAARQRLRANPAAWSLTGATYTLCSHQAMDAIVDMVGAPVMPWDALICATSVAQHAVKTLFQLQAEYYAWRFGVQNFTIPQLPIIPFGIHQKDFLFTDLEKQHARDALKVDDDTVAVLFAGRLSFHAKAHPYPMIVALEEASKRTKKKIALLLCGQFPNESVHQAFIKAAAQYAPHIQTIWIDGKDPNAYNRAWAAGDIFVSLSDNLQETFGITPVEAMASAMPVLVSDWDGYKDTVVDGITGYRIPTWMPPPDIGMSLAAAFEAGTINYDRYIGLACMEVSLDNEVLTHRLIDLISNPAMRLKMGLAGRERVNKMYDWSVVMEQHLNVWDQLDQIRREAQKNQQEMLQKAPKCAPNRQDPYRVFASFPTQLITPKTSVELMKSDLWPLPNWNEITNDPLFSYAKDYLPQSAIVEKCLAALKPKPMTIEELAKVISLSLAQTIQMLAPLAKVGLVRFQPESKEPA